MAFVAVGTLFNAEGASASVNIPSHSNGDMLVLSVGTTQVSTSPASTINTPGGALTWTQQSQDEAGDSSAVALGIFTAVGDGSETSVSVSVSGGTGNPRFIGAVMAFSDRGYVLENGVIRLEGTSAELAEDPEVRRAYLGVS